MFTILILTFYFLFFFTDHTNLLRFQDLTEEDIESELAIIRGQMAYVKQLQGFVDDALQLYNQIIKLK